jgi:hypothetical protein
MHACCQRFLFVILRRRTSRSNAQEVLRIATFVDYFSCGICRTSSCTRPPGRPSRCRGAVAGGGSFCRPERGSARCLHRGNHLCAIALQGRCYDRFEDGKEANPKVIRKFTRRAVLCGAAGVLSGVSFPLWRPDRGARKRRVPLYSIEFLDAMSLWRKADAPTRLCSLPGVIDDGRPGPDHGGGNACRNPASRGRRSSARIAGTVAGAACPCRGASRCSETTRNCPGRIGRPRLS